MKYLETKFKFFFSSDTYFYILIFLISVCVFKVINTHNIPNNEFSIKTTISVLENKPDWIAFQNRLLGPYLIFFLSKFTNSFVIAWKIYTALLIFIENFTLCYNYIIKLYCGADLFTN